MSGIPDLVSQTPPPDEGLTPKWSVLLSGNASAKCLNLDGANRIKEYILFQWAFLQSRFVQRIVGYKDDKPCSPYIVWKTTLYTDCDNFLSPKIDLDDVWDTRLETQTSVFLQLVEKQRIWTLSKTNCFLGMCLSPNIDDVHMYIQDCKKIFKLIILNQCNFWYYHNLSMIKECFKLIEMCKQLLGHTKLVRTIFITNLTDNCNR